MPRVSPIQESFASGELSANVRGRVSADVYKTGLKFCENWVPQVQGALRLRDGMQFASDMDPRNNAAILFTFQVGSDQDQVVEVGDNFILFRDGVDGTQITGGSSGNLVTDPVYLDELTSWNFNDMFFRIGAPDFSRSKISWDHPARRVTFTVTMNNDPGLPEPFTDGADGGAISQVIQVPAGAEAVAHTVTVKLNCEISPTDLSLIGGQLIFLEMMVVCGAQTEIIGVTGNGLFEFDFLHTPNATSFNLTLGCRWTKLPIPPFHETLHRYRIPFRWRRVKVTVPLPAGSGDPVEFASPYSIADLVCMHSAMDPGEAEMWLTTSTNNVEPQRIKFDPDTGDWTMEALTDISGFIEPVPMLWTATEWPSTVAIRDGRLWFGNIPLARATIWGSAAGNYVDFGNAGASSPDDPLLFPLAAAGKITALSNKKQLVVNTDVSEIVGASSLPGNVIAFNDFGFPLQTEWGSSCVQPVGVGRQLVYASPANNRLRTFSDEGGTNFGWDGMELNLFAHDLFQSRIVEMDWADDPSYQFLCVLADGTMAAATYYYPEKVLGFYRITTDGLIKSVTAVNTADGTIIWLLVVRDDVWRVEKLPFNRATRFSMDSWAVRDISSTGAIIDLDHLEDRTVKVVIRQTDPATGEEHWAVYPDEVVAGGSIQLTNESVFGEEAAVGLPIKNSFQLLSTEGVSHRGTSQVSKRRWNKVFLRLVDSAIPLVEGQYPRDRFPATPMNLGESFKSGDFEIIDLGSGEGDITISQDKPLATEVAGLFGKLSSTEI